MPDSTERLVEIISHSPAETHAYGFQLGESIQAGDVICLAGELGAGKTTLMIGIGRGWGAQEVVNSPTFVFVNEYSRAGGGRLYHVDAYRLRDATDAESIALPDMLNDPQSIVILEWPERVLAQLPTGRLWIELQWVDDNMRHLRLEASGERHEALLSLIHKTTSANNV